MHNPSSTAAQPALNPARPLGRGRSPADPRTEFRRVSLDTAKAAALHHLQSCRVPEERLFGIGRTRHRKVPGPLLERLKRK